MLSVEEFSKRERFASREEEETRLMTVFIGNDNSRSSVEKTVALQRSRGETVRKSSTTSLSSVFSLPGQHLSLLRREASTCAFRISTAR